MSSLEHMHQIEGCQENIADADNKFILAVIHSQIHDLFLNFIYITKYRKLKQYILGKKILSF